MTEQGDEYLEQLANKYQKSKEESDKLRAKVPDFLEEQDINYAIFSQKYKDVIACVLTEMVTSLGVDPEQHSVAAMWDAGTELLAVGYMEGYNHKLLELDKERQGEGR